MNPCGLSVTVSCLCLTPDVAALDKAPKGGAGERVEG
jgi:hypothetical protein